MSPRRAAVIILTCLLLAAAAFYLLFRVDSFTAEVENDKPGRHVDKPKIAFVGDIACPPGSAPSSTACQSDAVAKAIESKDVDAVLLAGDLQYDAGEESNFRDSFAVSWINLLTRSFAAPGNHEYGTRGASGYFNFWNGQPQGAARAGEPGKGYYAFDIGSWRIIALNSNCESVGGCGPGSAQAQWLAMELEANKPLCTLAFWHHPVFSSGNYQASEKDNSRGRYFWQLLEQNGADVIVNGHDHLYERFAPQTSDGSINPKKGVRQFIVGTGGKSLYKLHADKTLNHEYGNDSSFGFLEMELAASSYSWQFVGIDGQKYDAGRYACHN